MALCWECPKAGNELLHTAVRWHRRLTQCANTCGFGRALDPAPARHHRELHQHCCSCYWAGNVSGCPRVWAGVISLFSPRSWSRAHRDLVTKGIVQCTFPRGWSYRWLSWPLLVLLAGSGHCTCINTSDCQWQYSKEGKHLPQELLSST